MSNTTGRKDKVQYQPLEVGDLQEEAVTLSPLRAQGHQVSSRGRSGNVSSSIRPHGLVRGSTRSEQLDLEPVFGAACVFDEKNEGNIPISPRTCHLHGV